MKHITTLVIISSLVLAAGCSSHREQQAKSNENMYSPTYGGANTESSSTTAANRSAEQQNAPSPAISSEAAATATQPTSTDFTLMTQAQQELKNDPALAQVAPNIQITAQNGTVTLNGNVSSDEQKQKIEALIRSVSGVASINDQLKVSSSETSSTAPAETPTPSQTPSSQTSISSVNQTPNATTTTTDSGQTSTSSSSPTPSPTGNQPLNSTSEPGTDSSRVYSKDQSSTTAGTQSAADTLSANISGTSSSDKPIAQQLSQTLRADASLAPMLSNIKINVNDGKATLTGTVKSDDEKKKIESAVQGVSGITSVDNHLQVSSTSKPDDTKSDTK